MRTRWLMLILAGVLAAPAGADPGLTILKWGGNLDVARSRAKLRKAPMLVFVFDSI